MNVLSLFDGISCGQIALERIGDKVDKYFASEIDEYAIKITQKHYPETVQLGDVAKVKGENLPRIDLLMGGSPCQGFSIAGKRLNFDDERSKLFFEFVRLLRETKPKYFLLENVKMKQEYQDVISHYLRVLPIEINSSLVSAQNRKRLYWTNIPNVIQPSDKKIFIKDILDDDVEPVILHNIYGGFKETEPRVFEDKSPTIRTAAGGGHIPSVMIKSWETKNYLQYDLKSKGYKSQDQRAYYLEGKHGTLPSISCGSKVKVLMKDGKIRKLSPRECEKLQTLPENFTLGASNSQRYKMIGNGWTVDVICHILSCMET
jgi:DNA (cytosine-5)-methyltransferase 3A